MGVVRSPPRGRAQEDRRYKLRRDLRVHRAMMASTKTTGHRTMQLKTILNFVQKQPGFVYERARLRKGRHGPSLEVALQPRKGSRPVCSGCFRKRPAYDRRDERRFEFVPLWGIAVFLLYAPRRCDCSSCGIKVELMPWAIGKSPLTASYA